MSSKKATVSAVVPLKNVPGVDPAPAAKLRVLPAVASSFPVSNLPEEILTGEQVAERLTELGNIYAFIGVKLKRGSSKVVQRSFDGPARTRTWNLSIMSRLLHH